MVFFFNEELFGLANANLSADVEGGDLVLEPINNLWKVHCNETVAKCRVFSWKFVADFAEELSHGFNGGFLVKKSLSIVNKLIAHLACKTVILLWNADKMVWLFDGNKNRVL